MAELRELNVEEVEDWNISDLRSTGPSLVKVHVEVDYFSAMDEHRLFAPTKKECYLPDLSSASFLKTIVLDSCVEL